MAQTTRAVGILAALVAATVLTGCHKSSNVDRCDRLLFEQAEQIGQMGGWLRCDPSTDSDEPANATHVVQWNRFRGDGAREPQAWLWQARLDDRHLQFYADVVACEVRAWRDGRVPPFYLDRQLWGVPGVVAQECADGAAWRF